MHRGTAWVAIPVEAINEILADVDTEADLVVFQQDGDIIATEHFVDDRYELHVTFPLSWPEVDEDDALPAK